MAVYAQVAESNIQGDAIESTEVSCHQNPQVQEKETWQTVLLDRTSGNRKLKGIGEAK